MKVTLVGTLPPFKGITAHCKNLVENLDKDISIDFINFRRLYPEFLYPSGSQDKDIKLNVGPNVSVRRIMTYYNPFSWIRAGFSLKDEVVHIQWWTFYLFPILFTIALMARLRGKKIVLTVHNVLGHESGFIDRFFSGLMFRLADKFILFSNKGIEQMNNLFGISLDKMVFVPHGTYGFYEDAVVSKSEARDKLELDFKDKVVLFFGNIRGYKGLDVLLKAFAEVSGRVKGARLLIAGACWGSFGKYSSLIEELDLGNCVKTYIGYVPTPMVKHYFTACDLVVLPYKHFDAQSGPGNIALAFGKAMVVSDVGGLPELVADRKAVVKPGDADALAEAIVSVLSSDSFRKKLEGDSRRIAKLYSWDKIAEMHKNIYLSVLGDKD